MQNLHLVLSAKAFFFLNTKQTSVESEHESEHQSEHRAFPGLPTSFVINDETEVQRLPIGTSAP